MSNNHEAPSIGNFPVETGGDGLSTKKKRKKARELSATALEGAIIIGRAGEAEDKTSVKRDVLEKSIWQRIMPAPPEEKKKVEERDTLSDRSHPHSEEDAEKKKAASSERSEDGNDTITQEMVVEAVLDDDYEEIESGNRKSTALEFADERISEIQHEAERLPAEAVADLTAVGSARVFYENLKKGLRNEGNTAAEGDELPSLSKAISDAAESAQSEVVSKPETGTEELAGIEPSSDEQLLAGGAVDEQQPAVARLNEQQRRTVSPYLENADMQAAAFYNSVQAANASAVGGGNMAGFAGNPPGNTGGYAAGHTPNAFTSSANRLQPEADPRNSIAGPLLLGGVIGYIIGRRGGRKRERKAAEARMLPLREQLQIKEIEQRAVRAELAKKEAQIRQMASEHAATLRAADTLARQPGMTAAQSEAARSVSEAVRPASPIETSAPKLPPAPKPLFERIADAAPLAAAAETAPPSRIAEKDTPQEAKSNAVPAAKTAEAPAVLSTPKAELPKQPKRSDSMSKQELLQAAEQIIVGGESVAQAYESRDIGEASLRRIVAVHESGGDVRKALVEEKVKSSYERDPQLRSRSLPAEPPLFGSGQSSAVNDDTTNSQKSLPSGMIDGERMIESSGEHPMLPANDRSDVPPALVVANITAFVILGVLFIIWWFFIRA